MSGSLPPEEPHLSTSHIRNTKRRLAAHFPDSEYAAGDQADMEVQADGEPLSPGGGAWAGGSLAAKLRQPVVKPPIYTGEDNMDDEEGLDLSNLVDPLKSIDADLAMPVIDFTLEECQQLWKPWRKALILKVLGRNVSFKVLEQRTRDLWQLEWGCKLIDLEKGFYVARFFSEADYTRVLEEGPWLIMGHYLAVMKWRPNFWPSLATVPSTLVWIPLEFFNEASLRRVGCTFGRVVKIDPTTVGKARGRFARLCVELDLTAPLVPTICIAGIPTAVEYEGLYQICFDCGQYGHTAEACGRHAGMADAEALTSSATDSDVLPEESGRNPYGPWMMATYRTRRRIGSGQHVNTPDVRPPRQNKVSLRLHILPNR